MKRRSIRVGGGGGGKKKKWERGWGESKVGNVHLLAVRCVLSEQVPVGEGSRVKLIDPVP